MITRAPRRASRSSPSAAAATSCPRLSAHRASETSAALGDLEDIADYIARDNPVAAEDWVATLVEAALNVAGHPRSGRVAPEVQNAQIRELIVRGYRVVYRIEVKRLVVLTRGRGASAFEILARALSDDDLRNPSGPGRVAGRWA